MVRPTPRRGRFEEMAQDRIDQEVVAGEARYRESMLGDEGGAIHSQPRRKIKCPCGYVILVWDSADQDCGSCGRRFNALGQALRRYCCSLDEQGIDCGHGETF